MGTWSVFLIAHMLLAPDFKFSFATGLMIDLLIISFFSGEFVVVSTWHNNRKFKVGSYCSVVQKAEYRNKLEKKLSGAIILLSCISFIGALLYLYIFYNYFGSFIKLFTAGWLIREDMAEGLIMVPFFIRAMALTAYSALVLSLCYWIYFDFKWILTLPFISMLLMGVTQAARAGTFMMLIIIFIAAFWRDKLNGGSNIGFRLFKRVVKFTSLFLLVFALGLAYREQNFDQDFFGDQQLDTYKSYAFGAISAFSVFLDKYSLDADLTYGLYSFSSLFELLDIKKLPTGFYDEYLLISSVSNERTNVFTLFRSLIDDFGILGSIVYMFLMGAIFSYAFIRVIRGDIAALGFILMAYTMIVYSVIAPLTQHNTILLAFVMPSLVLYVITKNKCKLKLNTSP